MKSEWMRRVLLGLVSAMFLFVLVTAASAQRAARITFARGARSSTVTGTLNGYRSEKRYVIKVRAGQTLRTMQVGNSHDITIYIEDPDGEEVGDSDASCNNRREITPTDAGDYHIRVVECQKADRWRGTFRFKVTVR